MCFCVSLCCFAAGGRYDCEEGGWLREFPELEQKLGPPTGPPKMSDRHSSGRTVTAVFSREYSAGVGAPLRPRPALSLAPANAPPHSQKGTPSRPVCLGCRWSFACHQVSSAANAL